MRYSKTLIPTLRDAPADAEVISHKLMMRAGMIRKTAAGIYSYLPLALRVFQKIETIIRKEMTAAEAQEVLLPIVMPSELWIESGRWDFYGKELLRFKDRHNREFCMGPTHEEAITDLVRKTVSSYRNLPINLFQIQTKFRDEVRPRFGLMRGREFIMKDGYSFDVSEERALETYKKMYDAYKKIFTRCGLNFRAVEAGTGAIGGNYSHEFQVLANSGEDLILACDHCEYAANVEKAEVRSPQSLSEKSGSAAKNPRQKVHTPNVKTIAEVSQFLGILPEQTVKTLLFKTSAGFVAALVRGDHDLMEAKLKSALNVDICELADDAAIEQLTHAKPGFAGPIGLEILVIADAAVGSLAECTIGANETDYHWTHVDANELNITRFADLRQAKEEDLCPRCTDGHLKAHRGIEVGQVFYLGTKYSAALKAVYLDENGQSQNMVMGCYGIGVSRTAAAAIEQNNDTNGIIWPYAIAPFHFEIIPLNYQEEAVRRTADELYKRLTEYQPAQIDVLMDDRNESPGVKFKDADLLGIPYRIIIGAKGLANNTLEFKERKTGRLWTVPVEKAFEEILAIHQSS